MTIFPVKLRDAMSSVVTSIEARLRRQYKTLWSSSNHLALNNQRCTVDRRHCINCLGQEEMAQSCHYGTLFADDNLYYY